MDTNREDVGIAIRSAFLRRETKQRFSLFVLVLISIFLLFLEKIEINSLNYFRSFVKDTIYKSSEIVSYPGKSLSNSIVFFSKHVNVYKEYEILKKENQQLKQKSLNQNFLILENSKLKKAIDEQVHSYSDLVTSRVMIDKQSPYLNSFIINSGSNKNIKKGMEVLDGKNFIGRIVDVNFFSSRVLLVSDLNSRIPVIIEPSGDQAILIGQGKFEPVLQYLPQNYKAKAGDKVYTSGKEGIFSPGIPLGEVLVKENNFYVSLFSDLSQIVFVNVNLGNEIKNK